MQRILSATRLITLAAIGCVILIVANIAWFTHRPDEALSAQVEALLAAEPTQHVDDQNNLALMIRGMDVPENQDPVAVSAAWLASHNRAFSNPTVTLRESPPMPEFAGQTLGDAVDELGYAEPCSNQHRPTDCLRYLRSNADAARDQMQQSAWVGARYERFLRMTGFRDDALPSVDMAFPVYSKLLNAQQRWHAERLLLAPEKGRGWLIAEYERESRTLRFWLKNASLLIDKIMASASLQYHYEFSNVGLASIHRLPSEQPIDGVHAHKVPDSWQTPLTDEERSLRSTVRFETFFIRHFLEQSSASFDSFVEQMSWDHDWLDDLPAFAQRWVHAGFRPNVHINAQTSYMLAVTREMEVPFEQLPVRYRALKQTPPAFENRQSYLESLIYGEIGRDDLYLEYPVRLAETDIVRRLALLADLAREENVSAEQMPAWLQQAPIKSPYPDREFEWSVTKKAIRFDGEAYRSVWRGDGFSMPVWVDR